MIKLTKILNEAKLKPKKLTQLKKGEKFVFNNSPYEFIELYTDIPNAAKVKMEDGRTSVVSFGSIVNKNTKSGFSDYLKQGGRIWDNVNSDDKVVNEIKLTDLINKNYTYVIGSSEVRKSGSNDSKYVLGKIREIIYHYLFDANFFNNYLDSRQKLEYKSIFEKEVLAPMMKSIDKTLDTFFELESGNKVDWKIRYDKTAKLIDEFFEKNKKIPSDIKKAYYEYRLEYAGVKLKESVNEASDAFLHNIHFSTAEFKKMVTNYKKLNPDNVVIKDTQAMKELETIEPVYVGYNKKTKDVHWRWIADDLELNIDNSKMVPRVYDLVRRFDKVKDTHIWK